MRYSLIFISLGLFLSGCASGYKKFYQPNPYTEASVMMSRRPTPPPLMPNIERSTNAEEAIKEIVSRGYSLLGSSLFNSSRPDSEKTALKFGKELKADLVLVIPPKYTGTSTTTVPLTVPTSQTTYSSGSATAWGPGGPVTAYGSGTSTTYGTSTSYIPVTVNFYDYAAYYFIKQKIRLGISFRDLDESERKKIQTNKGVVVISVINDSPAYHADIISGDIVKKFNGVVITNRDSLYNAIESNNGKIAKIDLIRNGRHLEKLIKLNQ
jgi:hypothetical protein